MKVAQKVMIIKQHSAPKMTSVAWPSSTATPQLSASLKTPALHITEARSIKNQAQELKKKSTTTFKEFPTFRKVLRNWTCWHPRTRDTATIRRHVSTTTQDIHSRTDPDEITFSACVSWSSGCLGGRNLVELALRLPIVDDTHCLRLQRLRWR